MSTAILISGHARTFGVPQVYASQKWTVFNQCEDPYFFCSVVDDAQAASLDQLTRDYGSERVFIEKIAQQPDCEHEIAGRLGWSRERLLAATAHAPYALAPHASPQTVFRSLWHQQRTFDFFRETVSRLPKLSPPRFSTFIRHRPDLFWHRLEMPGGDIMKLYDETGKVDGCAKLSSEVAPWDVHVPYWGGYGGINDRFAIMGAEAARYYFSTYERLPDLLAAGCPLHPETLSGAALDRAPVCVRRTLIAEFTGVRLPDASGRCEAVPMVITEQDHFRHRAALAAGL